MSNVYTTKYIEIYIYSEYYRKNNENTLYLRITIQKCRRELAVKYKNINFVLQGRCFVAYIVHMCCILYSSSRTCIIEFLLLYFRVIQGTPIVYLYMASALVMLTHQSLVEFMRFTVR